MDQELLQMLGQLNQQHEQLQEQRKIVEQQLNELGAFGEELDVLEKDEQKTILAPLGKSVFAPMQFNNKDKVIVEVGVGYFVCKNLGATKAVVAQQAHRLHEFKMQLSLELDRLTMQLEGLLTQTQRA